MVRTYDILWPRKQFQGKRELESGKSAEEHLDEFCAFVEAQGCRIKSDLFGAFARHCANQESMTESVFKNCCKWMQKNLEWQCQKKGLPAPKAHVAKLPAVKATMGTLREQGAALKAERAARDRERQPVPGDLEESAIGHEKNMTKLGSADELGRETPGTLLTEPLADSCRALKAGKGRALIIASGLRH